jgi:hypothetical protein
MNPEAQLKFVDAMFDDVRLFMYPDVPVNPCTPRLEMKPDEQLKFVVIMFDDVKFVILLVDDVKVSI